MTDTAGITVTIKLFAGLRERANCAQYKVHLTADATVLDLLRLMATKPDFNISVKDTFMVAVNNEYVEQHHVLMNNDEVALIPPVSGGADQSPLVIITSDALVTDQFSQAVAMKSCGAIVLFHGVTRNHNAGREVQFLEYEAYQPMAENKIHEIIAHMQAKWELGRVAVGHRIGRLEIGEVSMVLAVSAPHRAAAFESALFLIDTLKQVVPIWKKEYFRGGSAWISEP